jgi:hypothetical protein
MPSAVRPEPPSAFWVQCVNELKVRRSSFRVRRLPDRPCIDEREVRRGAQLREFSMRPDPWINPDHVEAIRDLCLRGHQPEAWPTQDRSGSLEGITSWSNLSR